MLGLSKFFPITKGIRTIIILYNVTSSGLKNALWDTKFSLTKLSNTLWEIYKENLMEDRENRNVSQIYSGGGSEALLWSGYYTCKKQG